MAYRQSLIERACSENYNEFSFYFVWQFEFHIFNFWTLNFIITGLQRTLKKGLKASFTISQMKPAAANLSGLLTLC